MSFPKTNLTDRLQFLVEEIEAKAREVGLDFFPTIFELIDYDQLAEIAAYGGFPTRYPHWRFGMEYDQLSKTYTYGVSIIYEMVINNDPCYAYLLRANSEVMQKTVMAHVYAHCDFFKNNFWFSPTNRKMLDQMANHATRIRAIMDDVGEDIVENFIDDVLSIENLIDPYLPFQPKKSEAIKDQDSFRQEIQIAKLPAKKYMDSYINPKEVEDQQRAAMEAKLQERSPFPLEPERDVLLFMMAHAPLTEWQRQIVGMLRDEAYYFQPQGQTKILNEGWATFWHSKIMTEVYPLEDSEIVDYCDHQSSILFSSPTNLNPYKIGVELLRDIERRWDKGQFGKDYLDCDDPREREDWRQGSGQTRGREKIFEVRKIHNDITFLDAFLTEDFCHEHKLFLYDFNPHRNEYVLSSRNFNEIKQRLLDQLTNFGQPIISVCDANYLNRGELLLKHESTKMELKKETAERVMQNVYKMWNRPVHIETVFQKTKIRMSFDGQSHQQKKLS